MANLITPQMLKILMQRRKSAQAKEDKTVNPKIIKPLRREQYGISKRLEQEKAEGSPTEARRIDEYKDYTEEEKIWKTGESPEQLDRPKEVWERFDEELDEGIISPLDDPDPHLDRIHNQLIDEEVITQKPAECTETQPSMRRVESMPPATGTSLGIQFTEEYSQYKGEAKTKPRPVPSRGPSGGTHRSVVSWPAAGGA